MTTLSDEQIRAWIEAQGIQHMPWEFPPAWDAAIETFEARSTGPGATMGDLWIPQGQVLRRRAIEALRRAGDGPG